MPEIKIYNTDSSQGMKQHIPDESIDLIVADSPYNISRTTNFATMAPYTGYNGMDFGEWDKGFDQISWLKDANRVMKNPSSIVIFNCWQNLGLIANALENYNIHAKRPLLLRKTNPIPVKRDRLFINDLEHGLWAVKGQKWTFNRIADNYETGYFSYSLKKYTRHPTEKNLKIIKRLISILSNEGDTVLDPFFGSGTTAVACKQLNREFIGFEISKEYFDEAKSRLFQEYLQVRRCNDGAA